MRKLSAFTHRSLQLCGGCCSHAGRDQETEGQGGEATHPTPLAWHEGWSTSAHKGRLAFACEQRTMSAKLPQELGCQSLLPLEPGGGTWP